MWKQEQKSKEDYNSIAHAFKDKNHQKMIRDKTS